MKALYSRGMKSNDKTIGGWNDRANRCHCSSAFLIEAPYKAVNALWSNLSKDLKPTN
jgi:hypothetical protein